MHATLPLLAATDFPPLRRQRLDTLQVKLGRKCNPSCLHCHVAASPHFRALVHAARAMGVRVIDHGNLMILSEPAQEDLARLLAAEGVEITASLPCYPAANVDHQRGDGVVERSIASLRQFNAPGCTSLSAAASAP
jgi:hypothetical protein